jgi:hypothetical protein
LRRLLADIGLERRQRVVEHVPSLADIVPGTHLSTNPIEDDHGFNLDAAEGG